MILSGSLWTRRKLLRNWVLFLFCTFVCSISTQYISPANKFIQARYEPGRSCSEFGFSFFLYFCKFMVYLFMSIVCSISTRYVSPTKCLYQARYEPGRSCSEIGFSCSKMAIRGKGKSCKGDFLEVHADNQKTRWESGMLPHPTRRLPSNPIQSIHS